MKCPACNTIALVAFELQSNVTACRCTGCGGLWLGSQEFSNWIEAIQTGKAAESTNSPNPTPTDETKTAKICPGCGHVMTRYKIGHPHSFSLDRCGNCGGTWFDGSEWEILRGGPLWDQIHLIFSPAWQNRIRREGQAEHLRAQFAAKLGPDDFAESKRVKAWLEDHPHREAILAYLISENN
jgi:Zn-finger nucleic acid-binding protein